MSDVEKKESPEEFGTSGADIKKRWLVELKTYQKAFASWEKLANKIFSRYAGRTQSGKDFIDLEQKRFNVLWSNTQVLKPLLYARTPKPIVERRFKDADRIARLAAECLQRAIEYEVKRYRFDTVMEAARDDYLLPGRGISRIRYLPEFQTVLDDFGIPQQVIASESVRAEYVHYQDFRHGAGRTWSEVSWVAFRAFLTKAELQERFGEEIAETTRLTHTSNASGEDNNLPEDCYKKAEVWEVWDKQAKQVIWISEGADAPLDTREDPLGLDGFFPCPEPLYSTLTHANLVPTPDYLLYISQAQELDELTARIAKITSSIKAIYIRDGSCEPLDRILTESAELDVIAIENLRQFVRDGGIEGALFSVPVGDKVEVLIQLYEARNRVIQEIYEITGLSDIVRGASNASETATAQQIKGQYANLRLSNRQQAVQEHAAKLISFTGEVIAEKFTPDRLRQQCGYDFMADSNPNDPNEWLQILQIFRDDPLRNFRITIETDSTLAVDESVEKERRNEFLAAVGGFLGQVIPLAQQTPQLAPLVSELIKFNARGFTAGRQLEDVLEQSLQQFQDALMQPPAPQDPMQDPAFIKVQQDGEIQRAKMEQDAALKAQDFQAKMEEMQAKHQLEMNKILKQYEIDMQKVLIEQERMRTELQLKAIDMQKANERATMEALKPEKEESEAKSEPIQVHINAAQPTKKRVVVQRMPTGELVGEAVDVPEPLAAV